MRKWVSPRLTQSFKGDEEQARSLVPQARALCGYLFDQMRGRQKFRHQLWELADGSVIDIRAWDGILGERAVVLITAPFREIEEVSRIPFFALTWHPTGLCVTPKSEAVPHGYGFPKRDRTTGELINPPFGTQIETAEDEALNQVIFNKYPNNKYLDKPGTISGTKPPSFSWPGNPRLRTSTNARVSKYGISPYIHWGFGYEPLLYPDFSTEFWDTHNIKNLDTPGYNLLQITPHNLFIPAAIYREDSGVKPLFRQFMVDETGFNDTFYETESEKWYAHWPEELLYENAAFEEVFQASNELRDEVGEKPVTRPVRGFANGADKTAYEIALSGVMEHDSEEYRSGYGQLNSRIAAMGNNARVIGENIAIAPLGDISSASTGTVLVRAWKNSPSHYKNIVYDAWSKPFGATCLNVGGGYKAKTGFSYVQWFEQKDRWLYGGLFSNDTPYGPVSIRSLRCYLFTDVNLSAYDSFGIYFLGREYVIGQVIEEANDPEAKNVSFAVGATAYNVGSKLWLRAIVFTIGDDPKIKSFTCPVSNADSKYRWKEEVSLSLDPQVSAYLTSGFSFSYDGKKAVGSMSMLTSSVATQYFVNTSEPYRRCFSPFTIEFDATGAEPKIELVQKSSPPSITFDLKTQTSNGFIEPVSYEQSVNGSVETHTFYQGSEIKSLVYKTNMRCYQHHTTGSVFHCYDTLVLPSGTEIPIVRQNTINGIPSGDCFITSFLYLDPRTEDYVYAKIDLRKLGSTVYGKLRFYYNELLLKEYPEQVIASHYQEEEAKISGSWSAETMVGFISNVYDISFLRGTDAYGRVYPLPLPSDGIGSHYCQSYPSIYYHAGCVPTGKFQASVGSRNTCNYSCYTNPLGDKPTVFWSYEIGIPSAPEGSLTSESMDTVRCEFARYKDRVAIDIHFHKICKIKSASEDGDHILYTNFDAESELGIGPLKSLMPLGVV